MTDLSISREQWRNTDIANLSRVLDALDSVISATTIFLEGPPVRQIATMAIDGRTVLLESRSMLRVPMSVITISDPNQTTQTITAATHDAVRRTPLERLPDALHAAARAARSELLACTTLEGSNTIPRDVMPMRDALRVHLARAMADSPPDRPPLEPSVATGTITLSGRSVVSIRLAQNDAALRLVHPDGGDPFPRPPFGSLMRIGKSNNSKGHIYVRAETIHVSLTASLTRLPEDPLAVARLVRTPGVPLLVRERTSPAD